jgi:hypothetical protein
MDPTHSDTLSFQSEFNLRPKNKDKKRHQSIDDDVNRNIYQTSIDM